MNEHRQGAYLACTGGVRCALLGPANGDAPMLGDALMVGEPCTPAVVSRLLLDPCCLPKLPLALLLEGTGVPFELLLVGIGLPGGVGVL